MNETKNAEQRPLAGKVALVTGGSRGVGAVVARMLAEAGAAVAINYRDKVKRAEGVAAQVETAGSIALMVQADITSATSVDDMILAIKEQFGCLDLLILNASGGLEKDVAADYASVLNRDAQIRLVRKAVPIMPEGGRVVFVTSHLAHFHGERPVLPE